MAEATAFDASAPPLTVTNPGAVAGFQEYPKHLHRLGGLHVIVQDPSDEAAKLAQGWFLTMAAAEKAQADAEQAATDAAAAGLRVEKPKKGAA